MSTPLRIHHLDCGTMCPHGLVPLGLAPPDPGHLVAHCLLVEAPAGLVLVDTGYGTGDVADPRRLGPARHLLGARLDPRQTAVARVRALGLDPADVRHVLVTHLDLDHAGGLGDFPNATVHLHAPELVAARARRRDARLRYRPAQWAHGPRWAPHATPDGDRWRGFERVSLVADVGVQIALVPLPGHSAGHAGYAIDTGAGWLLHAGDAFLHPDEIATPPVRSRSLRAYHRLNSADHGLLLENAARLGELARDHADDVDVLCSHDAVALRRHQALRDGPSRALANGA
ncbi:MBL fold metallo-hydrolase [Patulibacter sp.]|uniref:MBL fold metallo-hydrolase n=1 Tax=Patulibacter sp. TaxID=1912859 RepID=UPI002719EEC1|nr:MBL fold metallo-hydrolase [Patulibacter sp.]MDO9407567.1 MBL fold metallo-hydrolase [Patulibacter sp.]